MLIAYPTVTVLLGTTCTLCC